MLGELLHRRRVELLAALENGLERGLRLDVRRALLRSELPALLSWIADREQELTAPEWPGRERISVPPLGDRACGGRELFQLVLEMAILRDCLCELLEREGAATTSMRAVSRAMDNAVVHTVERGVAKAQQDIRAGEEILAIVSHDLKTPLTSIGMAVGLLERTLPGDASPLCRRQLEIIRHSSKRMQRLIFDLLDFSCIRTGRLSVELVPQPVGAVLAEAPEAAKACAAQRGIRVEVVDRAGESWIRCDRERLLQVFSNLLSNAVKFSPPGARVTIGAEATGAEVRLWVSDEGQGIEPGNLARLFEPFWTRGAKETRGVGLGLYISKGIVEAHGGRFEVKSDVGVGSTFSFTLPAASAS
ncbi:MAG: HAMP domain-containing histidine kinase [Myxococcales bacterium]|nr:HAMP domain-containing histidine kinase [Myxococcales bacterium]